jgi:hypothetical protein
MPAIGHDDPRGQGYVVNCCLGEPYEVTQPGEIFRLGVLAETT